ncbi:MAG: LuxR C-terminal-related transcriptional regulator [bacterium]|nr:LuxR C-terminal-related transcriptional regulator [bacterium]
MFDMDVMQRSPFWLESADVKLMLEPLTKNLGITYFDYARFYHDNTCLAYFSDNAYVESFVKDENYIPPTLFLKPGKHLWHSYIPENLLCFADSAHYYFHGLTIYNVRENYHEFINFSGPKENKQVLDIYTNKFELLESFVDFFKFKIDGHINRYYAKRIRLPSHFLYNTNHFSVSDNDIQNYYQEMLDIVKQKPEQKIVFINDSLEILSEQEFECLRHLAFGYKPNKIAGLMNQPLHYIDIICSRLYEKTKSDNANALLAKLQQGKIYIVEEKGKKIISCGEGDQLSNESKILTAKLSKKESEISMLLVKGKTAKEIARVLNLSYRTVEHYIENVKSKFGVKRKAHLISFLLQLPQVSIP